LAVFLSEQVPGSVGGDTGGDWDAAEDRPRTLLASRTEIAAGELAAFTDGWMVEPVGSTAYKLARIAHRRGDLYVSRTPKSEWDVCAGVLLVQEAGGVATDLDGGPFRFNGADPYVHGMVATSDPGLHGEVRTLMRRKANGG
jgi:myo-inositol-1(or 4)-monophosphatase